MNQSVYCPNCKAELHGPYCAQCGQHQVDNNKMLLRLINEAFEDVFKWDSKAWRTTSALFAKPGFLTNEYYAGRRASYVPPLRLYIITSIVFFLTLSVINLFERPNPFITKKGELDEVAQVKEATEPVDQNQQKQQKQGESAVDSDKVDFNIEEWDLSELDGTDAEPYKEFIIRQASKAESVINENNGELASVLIDLSPPIIFVLLPIFALLLKLFYLFTGRYYTSHLVLAVHNHCFVFAVLTCTSVIGVFLDDQLGGWLSWIVIIWMLLYMRYSLLNVYQQSGILTNLKFISLFICYSLLLGFGGLIALFLGFLTL